MTRVRFPNLFLVGAMKAGTSSFHEYLNQHPEIFMSGFKEPQYFAPHRTRWGQAWGQGNPFPEPGIDWYLRLFEGAGDVKYAGESSVSYSARNWVVGCEARIHAFNPEARIIYLMRDPVERALSHYWHFVQDGREDRPLERALAEAPDYLERSHYAMQIRPYIETFGRDRVFVLTLESLMASPQTLFRDLFEWLEVDAGVEIDTKQRHNVGKSELRQTRRHLVAMDTALKHWRWRTLVERVPFDITTPITRAISRPVVRGQTDEAIAVEWLRRRLAPTVPELENLLGRAFPEWRMSQ